MAHPRVDPSAPKAHHLTGRLRARLQLQARSPAGIHRPTLKRSADRALFDDPRVAEDAVGSKSFVDEGRSVTASERALAEGLVSQR
jgi:hypothetical protein